ncbi:CopG family transcriptional regulator [Candidatus Poriferisodalis sp.]|uniref:ribbon-helix-helix domain-containing protein n=1 Tax=Candidatus Poriferisodalis sp. TaxID=3101277 RepID=UPI003B5BCA4F
MRRIQLYMEPDIDEALTAAAAKQGVSRSALMRDAVRALLSAESDEFADPLDALVGRFDVEPNDDIDAVIYGYDTAP